MAEPRVACTWLGGAQGARARGKWPRDHAGPRGCPCGAPRVLDIEETSGQLIGEATPLFNRVLSLHLFRVGLCSHTIFFYCRLRGGRANVGCDHNSYDRVDPSPCDHQIHHVRKKET